MTGHTHLSPAASGLFLMAMGAIVLFFVMRGQRTGSLPAGANFLRPLRINRDENSAAFHLLLIAYASAGIGLEIWGILSIVGLASPLRIH